MKPLVRISLAPVMLAIVLSFGGPRTAAATGPHIAQQHSQPATCPPRSAQPSHSRASDVPLSGEGRHHAQSCARGHVHDWLRRHFGHGQSRDSHGKRD
jgi:hypothetical protein